jgi:hypothetical protein
VGKENLIATMVTGYTSTKIRQLSGIVITMGLKIVGQLTWKGHSNLAWLFYLLALIIIMKIHCNSIFLMHLGGGDTSIILKD